ncbi:nuclear transport factor 2 family protein [Halotalea alkalilenta]|uniref:nuclear transport factor 2 family protein n=1 Tax=Halotalea alkalilenta TaxID=376489 RepID=UPI0005BE38A8|nr:nuclear transport factor 2 family protein [Halotalea alkalilenta]
MSSTSHTDSAHDSVADANVAIITDFLNNTAADKVEAAALRLVAPDAVYISLNFDNPELKQIEPWAGTASGPEAYSSTFIRVQKYWTIEDFQVLDIFGAGENVAVFGKFTYRANATGTVFTSPLAVYAKVRDGKIVYFQFMEDTYASAASFRTGGSWTVQTDPDEPAYEVGPSR